MERLWDGLRLVLRDAGPGLVEGEELVVEERTALVGRQLGALKPAHVPPAVEADSVAQVERHALVDGDAPVLVGADEVRPREAVQGSPEQQGDEPEGERRPEDAPPPARPPAPRPLRHGRRLHRRGGRPPRRTRGRAPPGAPPPPPRPLRS